MMIVRHDEDKVVAYDTGAVRLKDVRVVDYEQFEKQQLIRLKIDGNPQWQNATGFNALMIVYALTPTWLEGKPFIKWKGNSWVVHNLVAHPLMQLLAFCKCYKLAMKVHDRTVPQPIGFKWNSQSVNVS